MHQSRFRTPLRVLQRFLGPLAGFNGPTSKGMPLPGQMREREDGRKAPLSNPFRSHCCFYIDFYPRDAMLARVIVIATCPSVCPSVRPSVCPSVARRYCVKTKKASGMISSHLLAPRLVFWRQISSPNSKGFPPNGDLKHGSVGKIQRFFSFKRLQC